MMITLLVAYGEVASSKRERGDVIFFRGYLTSSNLPLAGKLLFFIKTVLPVIEQWMLAL